MHALKTKYRLCSAQAAQRNKAAQGQLSWHKCRALVVFFWVPVFWCSEASPGSWHPQQGLE